MAKICALVFLCILAEIHCWEDRRTCPWGTWPPRSFRDNSFCESIGLSNLADYRYGYLLGDGEYFPYFSTRSLEEKQTGVTTAVIWIHGHFGNANAFFCTGVKAARAAGRERNTVTVAPWFGAEVLPAPLWSLKLPPGRESICWKKGIWLKGNDAADHDYSSFAILDMLFNLLRGGNFPDLQAITIAGFSAGCQMVSRWAFFSNATDGSQSPPVTAVVGDCSSYMYLDQFRPSESCSPRRNTGIHHTCKSFEKPTTCATFNRYKYGIDVSSREMRENSYLKRLYLDYSPEDQLEAFAKKDMRFLLGSEDFCNCRDIDQANETACFHKDLKCHHTKFPGCCDTFPDSKHSNVVDIHCAAMLQGSNRLQRGLNYVAYLEDLCASHEIAYSPKVAFFKGSHDNVAWAMSSAFREWTWKDNMEPIYG